MRCEACGQTTTPRERTIIRGVVVPVCPCRPRHADLWWVCHCDDCEAFRLANPRDPWLHDLEDTKIAYWYINWRVPGADSLIGGFQRCDTRDEVDALVSQLKDREASVYVERINR